MLPLSIKLSVFSKTADDSNLCALIKHNSTNWVMFHFGLAQTVLLSHAAPEFDLKRQTDRDSYKLQPLPATLLLFGHLLGYYLMKGFALPCSSFRPGVSLHFILSFGILKNLESGQECVHSFKRRNVSPVLGRRSAEDARLPSVGRSLKNRGSL